jgi:TonB family protein
VQFDIDRTFQEPAVEDKRVKPVKRAFPEYPEDARAQKIEGTVKMLVTIDSKGSVQDVQVTKPLFPSLDESAVATVRKWQFEPFYVDGKAVTRKLTTEVNFNLNSWEQDKRKQEEEREQREAMEKLKREAGEVDTELAYRRALEIEAKKKAQAELAKHARISMDQAIQIATSKYPGTVMEGNLMAERWEATGVLAKDSDVLYHLRILPPGEDEMVLHVWVSATDGQITKIEKERKEEPKEENSSVSRRTPIKAGILNSRAISLPPPEYPAIARAAGAEGTVVVDVVIDETGNVVEAAAVSGHPLLQSAAVGASRQARFAPTRLEGQPVRVRGTITYNFVRQ